MVQPPAGSAGSSTRFLRGWSVVGAVFVVLLVTAGLGFYNAGVILNAAVDELDLSVGLVSVGTALFFGVSGVSGFLLARLMDTVDIRWFYTAGGIIGGVALWGLRFVEGPVGLFAFFVLYGLAFATAGLVPSTTVVARWFSVRRAVALSIASTGLSVGGIVLTPVATRWIDDDTLAGASTPMAVVWVLGIIPITWLAIRSWPSDVGLHPDGAATPLETSSTGEALGATFAEGRSTRFFLWLCAAYAVIFLAQVGGINHLFNLAEERVDTSTAAAAISTLALSSVVGRLAGGVIVMRLSAKSMTAVLTVVQAVALAGLGFAESRASILALASLFGLSVGNLLMLQPLLVAEAFGVKAYSRLYATNQLIGTVGVAGGPAMLGLVHDAADYRLAFALAAGANLAGLAFLVLAGPVRAAREVWAPSPAAATSAPAPT